MRVFVIFLASVTALLTMNLSAQAQFRRPCNSACMQRRIGALEAEVARLNATTIKSGQSVVINSPTGCLSWEGPNPGSVGWVPPPCVHSTWVINGGR